MALPGYRNINGFFYEENYELMNYTEEIWLYNEIRNNDPIAVTSVEVLKSPLLSQGWDLFIENETDRAKAARDYLYKVFDRFNFDMFRYHYFLMLEYGVCWFEKIYKYIDGEMYLDKMYPIKSDTVWKVFTNRDGDIETIIQRAYEPVTGEIKELAILNNVIYHDCYNSEFLDPRGRSIYKAIRPYYRLKKNLLQSDARLRSRAAGIVIGEISANLLTNAAHRAEFESTLQAIGNNINNYAMITKDEQNIRLETPQSQDNNLEMLSFFNQQIFYNTQTQFMMAGIGGGQNGGRSNTESHKGTYVNKANQLMFQFDKSVQKLVNEILSFSSFAGLPDDEKPFFQVQKLSVIDTYAVADAVAKMGHVMKLRPEDEIWFRSQFGMPEIDLSQIAEEKEEQPVELGLHSHDKMTRQCKEILELEAIKRGFDTIGREAATTIREVYNKAIRELAERLAVNPENVKLGKRTEMNGKTKAIYQKAKAIGKEAMVKEIQKASGKKLELELIVEDASTRERLGLLVNRVWDNAEYAIQNDLLNTTAEIINQAGGVKRWLEDRYIDGNKKLLADIEAFVEGGIIDGRGEIIDKLGADVTVWEYTAILDENTCRVCEPKDGQRKTLEQWQAEGIQKYSPVNPGCLGGSRCRCMLVPIA